MDKQFAVITRCKDEFFIREFCMYYISQGADDIYIVDDGSTDMSIYDGLWSHKNIHIHRVQDTFIVPDGLSTWGELINDRGACSYQMRFVNDIFQTIRNQYVWVAIVDADEFITTKLNKEKTILQELNSTFAGADCIKIPWVVMCCNGLEDSPSSLLKGIKHRWNHDKEHPQLAKMPKKFQCCYQVIDVKSIFKTNGHIKDIVSPHFPRVGGDRTGVPAIVNGVTNTAENIGTSYYNLREIHVNHGYLLCYHYRTISKNYCISKLNSSLLYQHKGVSLEQMMSIDIPEIEDDTLAQKYPQQHNIWTTNNI